jgi:hypothetical protein
MDAAGRFVPHPSTPTRRLRQEEAVLVHQGLSLAGRSCGLVIQLRTNTSYALQHQPCRYRRGSDARAIVGLGHDVIARESSLPDVAHITATERPDVTIVIVHDANAKALSSSTGSCTKPLVR